MTTPPGPGGAIVALVGLGNIGSQTAALLAGVDAIDRVLLIDPDRYDAPNLGRQRIAAADIGRRKVDVQAKSLRGTAPHLQVEVFAQAVESLPLGVLRGSVILSCVDSRIARQSINSRAFALGMPWIDAALGGDGQVRSRIYRPGGGDCLECAWGPRDYELLEQRVPCAEAGAHGASPAVRATAAPLELGAAAAAMQVSLLRRLLSANGADDPASAGRQWFLDLRSGRGEVGQYNVNPHCRLDHRPWAIVDLARSASGLTLGEALRLPGGELAGSELALDGQLFVHRLRCVRCGHSRPVGCKAGGRIRLRGCRRCGGAMDASAADVSDSLGAKGLPTRLIAAPLSSFGLLDGDVFSVRSNGATRHYELRGDHEGTG